MRRGLVLALLLGAAPAWAQMPLRLVVEGPLACEAEAPLRKALQRWTNEPGPGAVAPVLTVRSPGPGQLALRLVDPASGTELGRTLTLAPEDCAEAPEAVALLVEAWLRQLPVPAPASPAEPTPPAPPVEVPPVAPSPEPPRRPPARHPSPPQPEVALSPVEVPPALPPAPPTPEPPPPSPPQPAPAPTLALGPELELGLGTAWGPGPSALGPRADAAGRLTLGPRLAVGLALATGLPVHARAGRGQVEAWVLSAQLPVLVALHPPGDDGFELGLTPGVDRVAAWSTGLPQSASTALWDPALEGYLGWRWALGGRGPFLRAGLAAGARARTEVFSVSGVGEVLTLPPMWATVRFGLGFALGEGSRAAPDMER